MTANLLTEQTWVAADGKSIKSTLSDYSKSYHVDLLHNRQAHRQVWVYAAPPS